MDRLRKISPRPFANVVSGWTTAVTIVHRTGRSPLGLQCIDRREAARRAGSSVETAWDLLWKMSEEPFDYGLLGFLNYISSVIWACLDAFFFGDMSPSGCTVVSGVVVVVGGGVCNRSQMRTSKCTCLIFWCEYRSWPCQEMHGRNFWQVKVQGHTRHIADHLWMASSLFSDLFMYVI